TLPEYRFRYSIFPNKLTVQPIAGDARSSDPIGAKGRQPSLPPRSGELHRRWPLSRRPSSHLHQGRRRHLLWRPISTVIVMANRPTCNSSRCPAPYGQIVPKCNFSQITNSDLPSPWMNPSPWMTPSSVSSASSSPDPDAHQADLHHAQLRWLETQLAVHACSRIHPPTRSACSTSTSRSRPITTIRRPTHPSTHLAARPSTLHTRASVHRPNGSAKHHLCISSVRTPSASHHDEIPDPALPDDLDAHEPANEIPLHHDPGSQPTGAADFSFFIMPKFGQK
ncbi:hypothetical protein ACLOJK_027085, partial [Asimina triloba]